MFFWLSYSRNFGVSRWWWVNQYLACLFIWFSPPTVIAGLHLTIFHCQRDKLWVPSWVVFFPAIASCFSLVSGVLLWKDCCEQRWAVHQGLTSLYAVKLWIFHSCNTFCLSVFVLVMASNGTLLKLDCFPCSLDAPAVWQYSDLKSSKSQYVTHITEYFCVIW